MPSLCFSALFRGAMFALCAALLVACAGTPAGRGGARLALVIGNAAYENAPVLSNPINDANDMCATLRGVGFTTLCHTNLRDRAEFDARVRDYVDRLGPNTVGVVYYSGHGVQAGNANFLIPTQVSVKTATEDPLRVLYGLDELFDRLREKHTRFQFVVLDACRTDLFPKDRREAGGRGPVAGTRTPLLRSLETTGRASSGLARIQDAPASTIVLYATASSDAAYDGAGRNGPLTKHVLRHIGTSGLLLDDFINLVTAGVANETDRAYGKRQTPFKYGSFSERFCFAGCPGEGRPPTMH
jgi:uncharacterized caspase-like protein